MATFVLVHGAWHGGWCWGPLERALRAFGHNATAPTLTGLGERSHLASPDIVPDTHVFDIVNHIECKDLEDVILVGHSYGGVIITGVAGRLPERIRTLVYLDAVVPERSGVSSIAKRNPERTAAYRAQLAKGSFMVEPDQFESWSDDPDHLAWLRAKCTPHPMRCLVEGVTLTGREAEVTDRHYILAERNKPSIFWEEHERVSNRPEWQCHTMPTKHDVMIEAPEELADLLHVISNDFVFRDFEPADAPAVIELWQKCEMTRPWNDPVKDIERKLTDRNGAFWVVCQGRAVIASVMIGYDGHRGLIWYLAVAPTFQRSGVGAELLRRAEAFLIGIGCPKVNLFVRKDNQAVQSFYNRLGYIDDDVYLFGKRLISDE